MRWLSVLAAAATLLIAPVGAGAGIVAQQGIAGVELHMAASDI